MLVNYDTCTYVSNGPGYAESVTNMFIEHIEKGTAPWLKPWVPDANYIPDYNPCSSGSIPKPYRGLNAAYLSIVRYARGYDDKRWITFIQAKSNGWTIKRGEHGSPISYFSYLEKDIGVKVDKDGHTVYSANGTPERQIKKVPLFKYYTVFNANQVEGIPPAPEHPDVERVFTPIEDAEKILTQSKARFIYDQYNRAFYQPFSDTIHLPSREAFVSVPMYYATALHELGHWTGHETRLNRDIKNTYGTELYAKEELRAELASYMLSEQIGIPFDPSNHAAYIKSWLSALRNDSKEILNAAHDAEKISRYLLEGPRERATPSIQTEMAAARGEER